MTQVVYRLCRAREQRNYELRETAFNPYALRCIVNFQAAVRGFQTRAREKRRHARERNMRVMRNAMFAAARLAANRMTSKPSEDNDKAREMAAQAVQKLAEQVEDLKSQLSIEAVSKENLLRKLDAEKRLRGNLEQKVAALEQKLVEREQKVAELEGTNELTQKELQELQARLHGVIVAAVAVEAPPPFRT